MASQMSERVRGELWPANSSCREAGILLVMAAPARRHLIHFDSLFFLVFRVSFRVSAVPGGVQCRAGSQAASSLAWER